MMHKGLARAAAGILCLLAFMLAGTDDASSRQVRNTTRTNVNRSVNRNVSANRDVNVNRNVNINRDIDVHRDIDVDVDHGHYHPVARAVGVTAAATVTAAAIGSIVHTLPPSCTSVMVNGLTYQQCGSAWYQPRYAGTQLSYVVVNPP